MRGLTRRMRDSDPQAVAALAVIQEFDELLARGASLEDALATAERLAGAGFVVRDELNDRMVASPGATLEGCLAPEPVPDHGADEVEQRVVAPIAVAEGRIGVVWTGQLTGASTELQHVVVERLAAFVAVDARRTASAAPQTAANAVDELTVDRLERDAAAILARRAGLPDTVGLVPMAARARAGIAAEALAALLCRKAGRNAALTVAGRTILIAATAQAAEQILGVVDDPGVRGWDIRLALGRPGAAHHLASGWAAAREAIVFTSSSTPSVLADDLGVLTLLASIPPDQVLASLDVRAVERVATRGGGDQDLALLARYCETGSLRETASALHMHHSSVDYRVKKLERDLGIDLGTPTSRMRALLAVRLWQVHRPTAAG